MAKPFLKWAGGKTQLIPDIMSVIDSMRSDSNSFVYVEPFVGGGSVLFHMLDNCSNLKCAIINDLNKPLIDCYRVIADNDQYLLLKETLLELEKDYNVSWRDQEDKKRLYLQFRDEFNELIKNPGTNIIRQSALFIFLNKCGFNGMYRVNSKGEYNIPWGQKTYVNLFDEENLDRCHVLLNEKVIIMNDDYAKTEMAFDLARVEKSDVIFYIDPPYRPVSESSSFVNYTSGGFDDNEQIRLSCFCDYVNSCGGKFVQSNSKSGDFFEKLYSDYHVDIVKARRNINSIGSKRGEVDEVLIYNEKKESEALF